MSQHKTIGRFEIVETLNAGSFGPVLRGRDPQGGEVAVKICRVDDPELRQRFQQAVATAAGLRHPNIMPVVGSGVDEHGAPFAAEAHLAEDLATVIEAQPPWSTAQKLDLLSQVAQGLAHAHAQGVPHLDLRPVHVRLATVDGQRQAVVSGFATARLASAETRQTQKGVTMATAVYLAPEQVRGGEDTDPRADIFAFGVVAFELLTWERPFRGQTLSALIYQVLYKEPVPINTLWPDCPASLAAILDRCLGKQPEERYTDFPSLLRDLEEFRRQAADRWAAFDKPMTVQRIDLREESGTIMSRTQLQRTAQGMRDTPSGQQAVASDGGEGPKSPVQSLDRTLTLPAMASGEDAGPAIPTTPAMPPQPAPPKVGTGTINLPAQPVPSQSESAQPVQTPPAKAPDPLAETVDLPAGPPLPMDPTDLPTLAEDVSEMPTMAMKRLPQVVEEEPDEDPTVVGTRVDVLGDEDEEPTLVNARAAAPQAPPVTPPAPTVAPPGPSNHAVPSDPAGSSVEGRTAPDDGDDEDPTLLTATVPPTPVPPTPVPSPEAPPSFTPPPPPVPEPSAQPPQQPPPPAFTPPPAPAPVSAPPASPSPVPPPPAPAAPVPVAPAPATPAPGIGDVELGSAGPPGGALPAAGATPATPAAPQPGSPKRSGGPPKVLLVVGGLTFLVLVAAVGWWFLGRGSSQPDPAATAPVLPAPPVAPLAGEPLPPQGFVQVDAAPWGKVLQITETNGFEIDLPAEPHTPLVLSLEPGTYRIVVAYDPNSQVDARIDGASDDTTGVEGDANTAAFEGTGDTLDCEVEVVAQDVVSCTVAFPAPAVLDYFKEAEWWQ